MLLLQLIRSPLLQEHLKQELFRVEEEITKVRKDLTERVEPEYQEAQSKMDELKSQLEECERIKTQMYDKQGAVQLIRKGSRAGF